MLDRWTQNRSSDDQRKNKFEDQVPKLSTQPARPSDKYVQIQIEEVDNDDFHV